MNYFDDAQRQFAFFTDDAENDAVENIVFKCKIKVCFKNDEDKCSFSPNCNIDQCVTDQCKNSDKRKRRALIQQTSKSINGESDLAEISKEISIPVVSPKNCQIMEDTVCLEIKNKATDLTPNETGKPSKSSSDLTITISGWILISFWMN